MECVDTTSHLQYNVASYELVVCVLTVIFAISHLSLHYIILFSNWALYPKVSSGYVLSLTSWNLLGRRQRFRLIRETRISMYGWDPSQCVGVKADLICTLQRLAPIQVNIQKQYLDVTSLHFERCIKQQAFFFSFLR